MSGTNATAHGTGHGSVKSYVIGFIASVVLTVVAFGVAAAGVSFGTALTLLVIFAVAQILVQLVCFMHLGEAGQETNRITFVFTLVLLFILVGGSLWVMFSLYRNMMPAM